MKKKVLSALLALSLLGQSAFAATNLGTYVGGSQYSAYVDANGRFSWKQFAESNPLVNVPAVIKAGITTTVKKSGTSTFTGHHTTANPLTTSGPTENSFDFTATLGMSNVRDAFTELYNTVNNAIEYDTTLGSNPADINDPTAQKGELWQQFLNSTVSGNFIVRAKNQGSTLRGSGLLTPVLKQGSAASSVFELTNAANSPTLAGTIEYTFKVKDGIKVSDLFTNKNTYLSDIFVTFENVTTDVRDTVVGVDVELLSASIELLDATGVAANTPATSYAIVSFEAPADDLSAAYVQVPSRAYTPGSTGGGGTSAAPKAYVVTDGGNNSIDVKRVGSKYYIDIDALTVPVKDGYTFEGWYLDAALTSKATGTIEISRTTYIYPKFTPGSGTAPKVDISINGETTSAAVTEQDGKYYLDTDSLDKPEKDGFVFAGWYLDATHMYAANGTIEVTSDTTLYAKFINVTPPANLKSDEHIAYIAGYPDGEVKPNNYITREEVVAAFYRLLTEEYKATLLNNEASFPDVAADRWSYEAIAAMNIGGFIVGDEDGNFNPAQPITRAEFATIAAKFAPNVTPAANCFTDIEGHWAYNNILTVYAQGWISGYEDGTFRPDEYITRAEAMAIINRMLVRYSDTEATNAIDWADVFESDWYYEIVREATNGHGHTRKEDGWNESWTEKAADVDENTGADEVVEETTGTDEAVDENTGADEVVDEATGSDETAETDEVDEILFESEK